MTNLDRILKSRDIILPRKVHLVKAMIFPVVICGGESWTIKKAEHWRTDAFELRWRRFLGCKEIKPVNPKGNQPWIFIGRTDAEAETSILWLPDGKNWLIRKDPDTGKDWRQEEKGTTEDEMVGYTTTTHLRRASRGQWLSHDLHIQRPWTENQQVLLGFYF